MGGCQGNGKHRHNTLEYDKSLNYKPKMSKNPKSALLLRVLFPSTSPPINASTLTTYMSSATGLDKSLMLLQYSPKIVIPILLALSRRIALTHKDRAVKMVTLAQRLGNLSGSISDARTMMRLLGE